MKTAISKMLARAFGVVFGALGPYRTWKLLHEMRRIHRARFDETLQFFLTSELPERPVHEEFLPYWLDDRLITQSLRQHTILLGSPFYPFLVFQEIRQRCLAHEFIPHRVLEVGPGMHLGVLFCFAAAGCETVAGVDIEPIREPDEAFYKGLTSYLAATGGFGWWRQTVAVNPYPEITHPDSWDARDWRRILAAVDYRAPVPSHALPFEDASFDLVYSVTAFEHFPEPDRTLSEIRRVLRPGGVTIHEVDMRHHRDMRYHKPAEALEFLTWPDRQHAAVSEKYGDGKGLKNLVAGEWGKEVYCNRLRLSDGVDLFKKHGFELLDIERLELLSETVIDRNRFVEPFRSKSMDDLSVLVARITARKQA